MPNMVTVVNKNAVNSTGCALERGSFNDFNHNVGGAYFTEANMQQLALYAIAEKMKTSSKIQQTNHEYDRRERLKVVEADLRERTLERKEVLRYKRELLSYSIFENSDGYLCKEQISAEGKTIGCKKICNVRNLRMVHYHSQNKVEGVYEIFWDGRNEKNKIYVRENDLDADKLSSLFIKAGVSVQTARDYKKNLLELVIVHLMKYLEEKELPKTIGWNKMKSGWYWSDEKDLTMEEVFERC